MNAKLLAGKLISIFTYSTLGILFTVPLSAHAEYYLVYGPPEPPACDFCERAHYPVHHIVHKHYVRPTKHDSHRVTYRKRNHYNIAVYYPVAVYEPPYSSCCGGFGGPSYYWVPAAYPVYFTKPSDRIVNNDHYNDSSVDTGTADNDVY